MNAAARYFAYLILAAAGLALGRYIVPASHSIIGAGNEAAREEAARLTYWKSRVAETVATTSQPQQKLARAASMLDQVTQAEFPALMNAVLVDEPLAALVANSWAEADAPGFYKYLANLPEHHELEMKLAAVLIEHWAQRDLRAAEAAASRLRTPGMEPDPLKIIALSQLRADVKAGYAYLQQQKIKLTDSQILKELAVTDLKAASWKGLDVAARMEWLKSLPASAWRAHALAQLAELWMQQNPANIVSAAQATGQGMDFLSPAADIWVAQDPAAAKSYFQSTATAQVRAAIGMATVKSLAASDPQVAWDFAQTELSGAARSDAQKWIAQQALSTSPEAAWNWIKDLADSPWRTEVLREISAKWQTLDSAKAEAWRATLKPLEQRTL